MITTTFSKSRTACPLLHFGAHSVQQNHQQTFPYITPMDSGSSHPQCLRLNLQNKKYLRSILVCVCRSLLIMAAVVDKWTRKLREKGQSLLSTTSSKSPAESTQAETGVSAWVSPVFNRVVPAVLLSEASVSMIVDCVSP